MSQDKHCTLLLVEDEVIIAMAEKKALEKYGYNVLLENSGEDALMLIDKDGYTIKVNAAHTRLFGAVPPPDYCLFY